MARSTTITAESVFAAADALVADGEPPSLRNVRKRLGGGSFGTILPLLQSWRRARAQAPAEVPSVELVPAVSAALDRLIAAAADVAEAVHEAAAQAAAMDPDPRLPRDGDGRLSGAESATLRRHIEAVQQVAREEVARLRAERDGLARELGMARQELSDLKAWRQRAVAHMKSLSVRTVE